LNLTAALQELFQQFPNSQNFIFNFQKIEKILQKKLGLTQAVFAYRQKDGFKSPEGKEPFTKTENKLVFQRLNRTFKPLICSKRESSKWLGFWPVGLGQEWTACYGLGRKKNGTPLNEEEKRVLDFLADRTSIELEVRRLWKCLERSDRQASVGFMSAAMVHEIRNPLTALGTLVQLLPQKKNDPEFMESFQKLMLREINHLTSLTETFLNFSKLSAEKAEWVDLHQVVGEVIQLLGPLFASKKIQLKSDNTPSLRFRGDKQQIESLIMNLLQNALQSVGGGGIVSISTYPLPRTNGSGPWVELKVRDNGLGISKENLGRIFDPFYSTKGEGTGLGLAICRKVVENHKGQMTVISPSNKGTIFRVLLPAPAKT
jgi:signal transduction histidine kinase